MKMFFPLIIIKLEIYSLVKKLISIWKNIILKNGLSLFNILKEDNVKYFSKYYF